MIGFLRFIPNPQHLGVKNLVQLCAPQRHRSRRIFRAHGPVENLRHGIPIQLTRSQQETDSGANAFGVGMSDRIRWILTIIAAGDALRVDVASQIARVSVDYELFSKMS
jgi:hypothetical protein